MGNQELIKIFGTPLNSTEMAKVILGIKFNYFVLGAVSVSVILVVCLAERQHILSQQRQAQEGNYLANDQTASLRQ